MHNAQVNDLPDPVLAPDDIDLIAISAIDSNGFPLEINPDIVWPKLTNFGSNWDSETLISAYRVGLFPMPYEIDENESAIGWWSPKSRAIFYPDQIHVSTSLKSAAKKFSVTVNQDFEAVMRACGNPERESGWINEDVISAFTALHQIGVAHSIEVWDSEGRLVGGLYGLELGGVFAGESMFHVTKNASKVALVHLGQMLNDGSGRVIDTQWMTSHLESMGAKSIDRREYCGLLPKLLAIPTAISKDSIPPASGLG
jgi:leucyl/phenylalanyl-tRNA--protein transferase